MWIKIHDDVKWIVCTRDFTSKHKNHIFSARNSEGFWRERAGDIGSLGESISGEKHIKSNRQGISNLTHLVTSNETREIPPTAGSEIPDWGILALVKSGKFIAADLARVNGARSDNWPNADCRIKAKDLQAKRLPGENPPRAFPVDSLTLREFANGSRIRPLSSLARVWVTGFTWPAITRYSDLASRVIESRSISTFVRCNACIETGRRRSRRFICKRGHDTTAA